MKLGVLSPLARAEVNAALATSGSGRAEHVERAREAVARGREILERFPPRTGGSLSMEVPATHLALAEAELSRATGPNPALWREAVDRTDYVYFRLYARWRLTEAFVAVGRLDEARDELIAAHTQASRIGAEWVRSEFEALAVQVGIDLEQSPE